MSGDARAQAVAVGGEDRRRLEFILRREVSLNKDSLMTDAHSLVEEHFSSVHSKDNILKASQLSNLENVARTATNSGLVTLFINNQSGKEEKRYGKKGADDDRPQRGGDKRGWTHNDLNLKLIRKLEQIAGRDVKRGSGREGLKDEVLASVRGRAAELSIPEEAVEEYLNAYIKQEVQMELLREFVAHFAAFYVLKSAKFTGRSEDEEER